MLSSVAKVCTVAKRFFGMDEILHVLFHCRMVIEDPILKMIGILKECKCRIPKLVMRRTVIQGELGLAE